MAKASGKPEGTVRAGGGSSPRGGSGGRRGGGRPVTGGAAGGRTANAVKIRAAGPRDAPALAGLRLQADTLHARLLPEYFRAPVAPGLPVPVAGPGAVVLLAEESVPDAAPMVLGYVAVKVVDTAADPALTQCRRAYVDTVVVDEHRRGAGIGNALMRAAEQWARRQDAVEVVLTVWCDNHPAEALYRRLGYVPVARVVRLPLDS